MLLKNLNFLCIIKTNWISEQEEVGKCYDGGVDGNEQAFYPVPTPEEKQMNIPQSESIVLILLLKLSYLT